MRWTRMVLLMVVACFAITPAAWAETYTVTAGGDEVSAVCAGTDCPTLRAAVAAAAGNPGTDAIQLPAQPVQLTQGQITIASDVDLSGAGARVSSVAGDSNAFRVLQVSPGATVTVTGVTLRDGYATEYTGGFRPGGVVLNLGALTLDRTRVRGGYASSGGGVANVAGTLTVNRSLIVANNGGSDAGGILNFNGGTVVVRNTTITGNHANQGGAFLSWGPNPNATQFEFTTIAGNTADFTGGAGYETDDALSVRGSLFAANTVAGGQPNCGRPPQNLGGNVESGQECGFGVGGVTETVDPELFDAGGDTDVLRLRSGLAYDLVPAGQCPATDQRGQARPVGTGCDAGAYESKIAPPVITAPAQDAYLKSVVLTGTATPDIGINVFDGGALITETGADGQGAWETSALDSLSEGPHTLNVVAYTDGEVSAPATVRVFVDRTEPVATVVSRPPTTVNRGEVSFTFSADEPGVLFECSLSGGSRDPEAAPCGADGVTYSGLIDGEYEFQVWAIDRAGNRSEAPSRHTFVVDSGLIATPTVAEPAVEPNAATLTFATSQADRTFRCRLVGPGRDGAFTDCTSPLRYEGLAPGDYTFTARSNDPSGNFADSAPRTFSVAGPVQAQPTATPTATPVATAVPTPTPAPTVNEDVTIRPTGRVLVKLPGTNRFIAVNTLEDIPLGSEIDTTNGRVVLRFESEKGKVQTATFYGGIFSIRQIGKVLELKLTEVLAACPKRGKAATAQSKSKPKKRKLWGDGKGSFRTSGKYSAATVRGTKWYVEDSCAGTLTRVTSGVVAVKHGKKTILVRAGKRYLAKAPR